MANPDAIEKAIPLPGLAGRKQQTFRQKPAYINIYKDWHKRRSSVRPGITGLWQVAGRSAVAFEDMILLDLYYIYNRSLVMDLLILWETLFVVLKRQGAY